MKQQYVWFSNRQHMVLKDKKVSKIFNGRKLLTSQKALTLIGAFVLLLIFSCSTNAVDEKAKSTMRTLLTDVSELDGIPIKNPPILTAIDALQYAVHRPGVIKQVKAAQKQVPYKSWEITVKEERQNGHFVWMVILESKGLLPSFICQFNFDEAGVSVTESPLDNDCQFNK